MRITGAKRWRDIEIGEVVLHGDTPRRVLANDPVGALHRRVLIEGVEPMLFGAFDLVSVVQLDESDAIGNLYAAGLNPAPIEE